MPHDPLLAERIRQAFARTGRDVVERRMFGGVAFLLNGHMCCGVAKDLLMLRLGDEGAAAALTQPYTRPMDFTGRPMKSMVYVEPEGLRTGRQLQAWVEKAVAFARGLSAKPGPKKRAKIVRSP
jgi:TfoX/Sxy family transcriptional regulator of competence genes